MIYECCNHCLVIDLKNCEHAPQLVLVNYSSGMFIDTLKVRMPEVFKWSTITLVQVRCCIKQVP